MDVAIVPAGRSFSQLGILVLDGSASMAEEGEGKITKAQMVSTAVREMLTRFRRSPYRQNFFFAVVACREQASVHTPVTPAEQIDDGADYDPTRHHGGRTDIGPGLEEAQRIAGQFLRAAPDDLVSSVVIVVVSGGVDVSPARTLRIAREIRRDPSTTICTTFLAVPGDADRETADRLLALASDPATGFQSISGPDALLEFFIACVSSGTKLAIA
jgi:Mg-chelatase subunit ChlD